MALLELVLGTHIEDCRRPGSQPIQQLDAGDRLQLVTRAEVGCHDAGDFGAVPLADPAQRVQQGDHGIFTREPIEDALAFTSPLDECSPTKKLQVAGRVRHSQTRPGRKLFDAPLALSQMFEQFEPMGVAERLRDLCEAGKDALFGTEA